MAQDPLTPKSFFRDRFKHSGKNGCYLYERLRWLLNNGMQRHKNNVLRDDRMLKMRQPKYRQKDLITAMSRMEEYRHQGMVPGIPELDQFYAGPTVNSWKFKVGASPDDSGGPPSLCYSDELSTTYFTLV